VARLTSAAQSRESEPGLAAREVAWAAVSDVLRRRAALDEALESNPAYGRLSSRDAALARAIATVTFRHFGTLTQTIAERLEKGVTSERLLHLLATGAAQILFLDVPDHAAVDVAVRLARGDRVLQHAAGMINAVLRRIACEGETIR
jgi:16S rRNA (cytosine967-C5)-methyltransferase